MEITTVLFLILVTAGCSIFLGHAVGYRSKHNREYLRGYWTGYRAGHNDAFGRKPAVNEETFTYADTDSIQSRKLRRLIAEHNERMGA